MYFIDVFNACARVARYVTLPDGSITWEYAMNWEELEEDAIDAVEDAGGWVTGSGHYPCPSALIARAVWPDDHHSS
jgi:hypothetical protein